MVTIHSIIDTSSIGIDPGKTCHLLFSGFVQSHRNTGQMRAYSVTTFWRWVILPVSGHGREDRRGPVPSLQAEEELKG